MTNSNGQSGQQSIVIPIILIGALFFIFGFVTWLNGILMPYLQIACELTNFQAAFVVFSFYISYTLMALPSSKILEKTGFKRGIMLGLLIMAAGTLVFIPAAMYRTFSIFLIGLFIMGTGLALLQTAVNPYITILGPRETAAVRFSIMGICNNIAGAIGPLVLAYYILNDGDAFIAGLQLMNEAERVIALDGLAQRVIWPYFTMTLILVVLGFLVKFSPLPNIDEEAEDVEEIENETRTHIFQYPYLVFGVIALFFYVGVEVIAGNTIVGYGLSLGIPVDSAKSYTTMVMVTMLVGYVIGIILIPKILSYRKVLISSTVLGLIFSVFALIVPPHLFFIIPWLEIKLPYTVMFIALLGLANSMIWPSIWPLAIHNLGRFIKQGSALLIMAIAGGAILPVVWGQLSDVWSSREAYLILIPAYLIILGYAIYGYKVTTWNRIKSR